jgi:hypothetical protein
MDQLFALGNVSNCNEILEIATYEISGDHHEQMQTVVEGNFVFAAPEPPKRTHQQLSMRGLRERPTPQYASIESGLAARSTWQINGAQISGILVDAHVEDQNRHVSAVLRTAHAEALIRGSRPSRLPKLERRMKERAATTLVTSTYGEPRLANSAGPRCFDLSQLSPIQ